MTEIMLELRNKRLPDITVLDVCCSGRMFWFYKKNPNVLYCDKRVVEKCSVGKGRHARDFECQPDSIMDFRKLKFGDKSFKMVVFDPPHLKKAGPKRYMGKKYGLLDPKNWQEDIRAGFKECFRVLEEDGVLIFKWSEVEIKVSELLKLSPYRPMFGHKSGKAQKTHWICFMKINNMKK